jgi:predicted PurR-regulated permease PerM
MIKERINQLTFFFFLFFFFFDGEDGEEGVFRLHPSALD